MNQHAIEVLEFAAVMREVQDYCYSQAAREALEAGFLAGSAGFARLEPELETLKAAAGILRAGLVKSGEHPSGRLDSPERLLEALSKPGLVLELEELAELHRFVRSAGLLGRGLRLLFDEGRGDGTAAGTVRAAGEAWLGGRLAGLPNLRNLEQLLGRYLDDTGQLKEDQIPELRAARQRIMAAQGELRKTAQSILSAKADFMSGEFATIRDGRMVIPLKTDYKGRLPGIVHQSSGTGATLFMEPFELVEKNNACSEAEAEYAQAVLAILRTLTANLANSVPDLAKSADLLAELDQAWCRARHSAANDGQPALPGEEIRLELARHPLLGKKAIPIDLAFGAEKRLMVISGPNTGGKTVAMKTLGLFALMNQAGLDIPAAQGSVLPLFSDIHADIGDEQSISQSLSTFSGHVSRISDLLGRLDRRSLVLLDELGSGTDPEEGSALALAVTEELLRSGALTLVTSHHGALKALAYSHPGACNASMEFSETELRPTYKVIPGIPGQSHALDIARRVGMPGAILDRARELLGDRQSPLEELVRDLGAQQQALREERRETAQFRQQLVGKEQELRRRQEELRLKELEIKQAQSGEASRFLREARSQVEAMVRELSAFRDRLSAEDAERFQQATARMRADLAALGGRQAAAAAALEAEEAEIIATRPLPDQAAMQPGQEVVVTASNQRGILERELKNGKWLVAVQGKKIEFKLAQLALPQQPSARKPVRARPVWQVEGERKAVLQLDLRGMRAVEATDAIIRQIDAALVQGMDSFGIIHGTGEGILQKAVREYLKQCPGVDRFEFARPEDGGFGKTIVFLRR
jgi:DNA mismatch repair protein MutS2